MSFWGWHAAWVSPIGWPNACCFGVARVVLELGRWHCGLGLIRCLRLLGVVKVASRQCLWECVGSSININIRSSCVPLQFVKFVKLRHLAFGKNVRNM